MGTHLERARAAIAEHKRRREPQPHPQDLALTELVSAEKNLHEVEAALKTEVATYRELDGEFKRTEDPDTFELVRAAMLDAQEARQALRLAQRRYEAARRALDMLR